MPGKKQSLVFWFEELVVISGSFWPFPGVLQRQTITTDFGWNSTKAQSLTKTLVQQKHYLEQINFIKICH